MGQLEGRLAQGTYEMARRGEEDAGNTQRAVDTGYDRSRWKNIILWSVSDHGKRRPKILINYYFIKYFLINLTFELSKHDIINAHEIHFRT